MLLQDLKKKLLKSKPWYLWVLLLLTRSLESLDLEEFVVNVGVFFAKLLLIAKTNWTRSSPEILEVLTHLLKPTTLKLTVYKERPSEHYTIKTYSPYNWLDSFLLLYWNPEVIQKSFGWSLESWWPGYREGREGISIFMSRISLIPPLQQCNPEHSSRNSQNVLKKTSFNG